MDERRGGASLQAFALGALLGVGVGILLAPRSGAETRRKLSDLAHKARERANEIRARLRHETEEKAEDALRQMRA